jgi:hypothetical protein
MYELFRHIVATPASAPKYCVAFHIDDTRRIPFIRFLLELDTTSQTMGFPFFTTTTATVDTTVDTVVGYTQYMGETYVFVRCVNECSNNKYPTLCLLDEILNYQCIVGKYSVRPECVSFLLSNPAYYTLYNAKRVPIEIPYVAFLTSNNVEIDHHFGPTKESHSHYSMTVLPTNTNTRVDKSGLIRYAVFGSHPSRNGDMLVESLDNVVELSLLFSC